MKIRTGDTVVVIAGKDKGKRGKVTAAFPREDRVIVEGVNVHKRHQRPQRRRQKGQIVEVAHPVHVSNIQLVDPKQDVPTRIGITVKEDKTKVRTTKKSGTQLQS